MQLDLFEDDLNVLLSWEFKKTQERCIRTEKAVFRKVDDLAKKFNQMQNDLDVMRSLLIRSHK